MLTIKKLTWEEQPQILPLLGRCFPDHWEQLAQKEQKMPFDEISFAAFEHGEIAGHCGVMIYEVCGRDGIPRTMGGIASVAVDPRCRNRGIAAALCRHVADWAENEPEIISLPLYTGLFRVYESVSWHKIEIPEAQFARSRRETAPLNWRKGGELSDTEKSRIAEIYAAMPAFPGKVIRKSGTGFHGWNRIFGEPDFTFAVTGGQYAVKVSGTLAETGFRSLNGAAGFVEAAVGPNGCDMLLEKSMTAGAALEYSPSVNDPMHGERVLVRDLKKREFHRKNPDMFFSLVDKF
ncbi:MAG: GNAT family N-acetyltransferase [Lentisphaeria bacterium]|nr:GNAT family N-acetyltransferase [Lentisphaeria bacterium]